MRNTIIALFKRAVTFHVLFVVVTTTNMFVTRSTYAAEAVCTEAALRDAGVAFISCGAQETGCSVTGTSSNRGYGRVYMIGDSVTEGSKAEIENALGDKGFSDFIIDGVSSRSLSEGEAATNGQTVLEKSIDSFKDASVVIIALGTNNGVTEASIAKAIATIRNAPSSANIWWVNIGVNNAARSTPLDPTAWNSLIASNAASQGYKVIDWASVVALNPEYIDPNPSTGLGVHPIGLGKRMFALTIANALGGTGSGNCTQTLNQVGANNQETAFDYFVRKGLTPIQSAAIVGNMIGESGVNPRRVEMTFFRSGHPCDRRTLGWPAETDQPPVDNIFGPNTNCAGYAGQPTGNVQPGYGLVQWSGGRRAGLIAFARSQDKLPSDLFMQLDYVWQELQTTYKTRVYDPLVASTTMEEAVDIWVRRYEIPANPDGAVRTRIPMANKVLADYGS